MVTAPGEVPRAALMETGKNYVGKSREPGHKMTAKCNAGSNEPD